MIHASESKRTTTSLSNRAKSRRCGMSRAVATGIASWSRTSISSSIRALRSVSTDPRHAALVGGSRHSTATPLLASAHLSAALASCLRFPTWWRIPRCALRLACSPSCAPVAHPSGRFAQAVGKAAAFSFAPSCTASAIRSSFCRIYSLALQN